VETYGILRYLADSWGLLLMVLVFAGIVAWVFRPGARKSQDDAARQIFRNEDKPKDDSNGD
jgi:cytochrome c oxidase cbb3-type subunit 4